MNKEQLNDPPAKPGAYSVSASATRHLITGDAQRLYCSVAEQPVEALQGSRDALRTRKVPGQFCQRQTPPNKQRLHKYKPDLAKEIIALMSSRDVNKLSELEKNDKYASAMARVHYLRAPAP